MLPYSTHQLDEDDIQAVVAALRSGWLTTGPMIEAFEQDLAAVCQVRQAVALSSGTAALHAALNALGLGPGDEVLVPAMTFVATANAVHYTGATPVIVDVRASDLLLDVQAAESAITDRTRALIAVDYAGQPADYQPLRAMTSRHGLALVADACHSLGASYQGRAVGGLADLTCTSFHPVKPITTGEGGAVLTDDPELAARARRFRSHGLSLDAGERERRETWSYEMIELGYNYRLTDFQAALGRSQLAKLVDFIAARRVLAARYRTAWSGLPGLDLLTEQEDRQHGYHLFPVRVRAGLRDTWFKALRRQGIGVNVHYRPLNLHAFYQRQGWGRAGQCPVAEAAFEELLSMPIFPAMDEADMQRVLHSVSRLLATSAS